MRLPTTPATTLLREVRDEVRQRFPGGRVIIAIGGRAGAGRAGRDDSGGAEFADALAEAFEEQDLDTFRASTQAFLAPRADSTDVNAAHLYDFETMRRVLIDPFRDGAQTSATTGFQLGAWDAARNAPLESRWVTAPADAVLLIDGFPLASAARRSFWDFSIWIEAATPGTTTADAESAPAAASIVINNLDPARPVRVRSGR